MRSLLTILTALVIAAGARAHEPASPGEGQPGTLRFAVATFSHETCTFCPGGDTTVEDWLAFRRPYSGTEVLDAGPYIRGFVSVAREYRGVDLIGLTSPAGVRGGSSRSWNTEDSFNHFMAAMLSDLKEAGPVDGVFLALHGAMATRNIPRPEAEIARRIREVVGPDIPIVATFDLHGNEDAEFLRHADMAFITKRYPHYDAWLQGERAARALVRLARGTYFATTASRKPGIITPSVVQWTGQSPSMDIMERARRWEARQPDAFVNIAYGFPWSDVPDVGATIHVMTNDDQALADRIADDMADFMWRVREPFLFGDDFPMPEQAVERAITARENRETPIVLADYSDRSGDATWILGEIQRQNLGGVIIGTIRDEFALAEIEDKGLGVGDPFERAVGGFMGPASGEPVPIQGTIAYVGAGLWFDTIAIIRFGDNNHLILTPTLRQVTRPEQLNIGPLDPDTADVFVVKSRVHFRRGFDETGYSKTIIITDAPGPFIGTRRLDGLPYRNVDLSTMYPYGTPPERR